MKHLVIFFLRLYQVLWSSWNLPRCRYEPTCSHYAIQAVRRYGAGRGLALALSRVLRCHPWGGGGYDPVP
ncbi:MAG: membrane protein insertion efficiency factor YidD [Firmicutes bacterium]|nr:membrane protein insertion efficiency factor YidD [Bacillota bacterium]